MRSAKNEVRRFIAAAQPITDAPGHVEAGDISRALPRSCGILLVVVLASADAFAQADPPHQQFLFAYKLLQRGEDHLAAEEFDRYLGSFPNAPKRGDALYYRAMLHRREGNNEKAAALLRNAPGPQLVRPYAIDLLLGQVLSDLGRHEEALVALKRIDPVAQPPSVAVSVLYLRGLAHRRANQWAAATGDLRLAAEIDSPMKARALLDLARVQVLRGLEPDAIQTLKQCLEVGRKQGEVADHAAAAEAARLAGDLSFKAGNYDLAAAFYGRVLGEYQSSRHFGPAVIGTLWSRFSAGRYHQVLDDFMRYRTSLQVQDRTPAWYLAGSAHQELGQHEMAIDLLKQISQGEGQFPLAGRALYKLAVSQFELGQYDTMNEIIAELRHRFPDSEVLIDAEFLLAAADAERGDVTRGAARLSDLVDQGQTNPYYRQALLRRARLYELHEKIDAAAADYRRYIDATTDGPEAAPVAIRYIDLAYRLDRFEEVETIATHLLKRRDLDALSTQELMYRLALAQLKLNKADLALSTLQTLRENYPLNPHGAEISYYCGVLLLSLERSEQAVPLLVEAAGMAELQGQLRANALRLIALHQQETSQTDAAVETLFQLEQLVETRNLTDPELLWLGRHFDQIGERESAMRYLQVLLEAHPAAPPLARAEALFITGKSQHRLYQFDEAVASFREVIALGQGFGLDARLELARTMADRGQLQNAAAELAELVNSQDSSIAAEALFDGALVQRQIAHERRRREDMRGVTEAHTGARRLLKRLVLLYPFDELRPLPQLAYLELAEIATELGDTHTATNELKELIEKYPDDHCTLYAKAVLAADRQRLAEAVARLHKLKTRSLDDRLAERVEALLQILEPTP